MFSPLGRCASLFPRICLRMWLDHKFLRHHMDTLWLVHDLSSFCVFVLFAVMHGEPCDCP